MTRLLGLLVTLLAAAGCAETQPTLATQQDGAAAAACGALLDQHVLSPTQVRDAQELARTAADDARYQALHRTVSALPPQPTEPQLEVVRATCARVIPGVP